MGHIFRNNYIVLATLLLSYCRITSADERAFYNNETSSVDELPPLSSSSIDSLTANSILSNTEESSISTIRLSSILTPTSESSIYTSTPNIIVESSVTSLIPSSHISDSVETSWNQYSSYTSSSESATQSLTSSFQNPYFNSTASSDSYVKPINSQDEVGTTSQVAGTTIIEVTTTLPDQTVIIDTNTVDGQNDGTQTTVITDNNGQQTDIVIQPPVVQTEINTDNNDQNSVVSTMEIDNTQPGNTQVQITTATEEYNPYHPERPQVNNDADTATEPQYTLQTTNTNINADTYTDRNQYVTTNSQPQNTQETYNTNDQGAKNTNGNAGTINSGEIIATNKPTVSHIPQASQVSEDSKGTHNTYVSDVKTVNNLPTTMTPQQKTDKDGISQTEEGGSKIILSDETGIPVDSTKTPNTLKTMETTAISQLGVHTSAKIDNNAGTTRILDKSQYDGKSTLTIANGVTQASSKDKVETAGNTVNENQTGYVVYSKDSKATHVKDGSNTITATKVGVTVATNNKDSGVSGKNTANNVVSKTPDKTTETNNGIAGAVTGTKTRGSSKFKTTVPYTLSANNDWLPSSIIVQTTKASKSVSSLNPSSFPTSLPAAIAAGGEVSEPSNTTLVTIGFGSELNYNFLVENPLSSAQIFNFLPEALLYPFYVDEVSSDSDIKDDTISYESIFVSMTVSDGTTTLSPTSTLIKRAVSFINDTSALAHILSQSSGITNTLGNVNRFVEQTSTATTQSGSSTATALSTSSSSVTTLDGSLIKVKQISPYIDPKRDYVVSVAEVYFPSDFIDSLRAHLEDKESVLYDNPVPSLKSLMNLTDSSVALQGLVHNSANSESSSDNSENSAVTEQEVNQVFKSSIKNGTQYGSLDVTGIKGSSLSTSVRNRLIIFLTCLVFGTFMWVLGFFALFRFIKRRLFAPKSISLDNPRHSIVNITKIGLYGDDIGSLWSGDSSNSSDSFNEKVKNIMDNRRSRHKGLMRKSHNADNLSLCYNNFIENANGDTLITTNGREFSPVSHEFADYTHQTISISNSSQYGTVNDSFDFELANTHNNPFSDNYRLSPRSKTIDLFSDDLDENFEIGEEIEEEESVADIYVAELDDLDEELYKNLMGTIKGRDPNDPLSVEAKKLMAQIGKQYPNTDIKPKVDM